MTSFDLSTTFIEKLMSRAWFWYIIYLISWKLKIWPIFQIFGLGWPRVTSWPLFWNSDVKSVLLIYDLPTFNVLWNLTLNEPKFVIWPQIQFFSIEIILRFHWSFWAIFCWDWSIFVTKQIRFADGEMLKIAFLNKTGSTSGIKNRAPSVHAQLIEDHFDTHDDVI